MIMTPGPAFLLDQDQRSTVVSRLGRLLGGSQASFTNERSSHISTMESSSPIPIPSQKIPFFRRTKSISAIFAPSRPTTLKAASPSDKAPETTATSTPLTEASKSHSSNVLTNSDTESFKPSYASSSLSRTWSATSRSSSSTPTYKYSRPPSPPSVYASFGYERPIKKPRPLPLDSGKLGGWKKIGDTTKSKSDKIATGNHQALPIEASPLSSPAAASNVASAGPSTSSIRTASSIENNGDTTENLNPIHDSRENVMRSDRVQNQRHENSAENDQIANSSSPKTATSETECVTVPQEPHSTPETLSTPLTPIISNSELRRWKMERLYRTLGESVPPELVFREVENKRTLQGRGRSKDDNDILKASRVGWRMSAKQPDISTSLPSSRSLEHFPNRRPTSAPSPTTELTPGISLGRTPLDTPIEFRPTSVSSVSDDYGSASQDGHWEHRVPSLSESELTHPPPESVGSIPSPAIPAEEVKASSDTHHSRGKSEQIFANAIPKSYLMTRSSSLKVRPKPSEGLFPSSQRSPAPFAPYFGDTNLLSPSTPTEEKSSGVRRKERKEGWSGEWNLSDMQDVIQRLRDLK